MQAVNALHPPSAGDLSRLATTPSQQPHFPPDLQHLQGLKQRLKKGLVSELQRTVGILGNDLPMLWDCDFLHGQPEVAGEERYVRCEVNAGSAAPFPDFAIEPLVDATVARLPHVCLEAAPRSVDRFLATRDALPDQVSIIESDA